MNLLLILSGVAGLFLSSCAQTDVRGTGNVERLERQPKPVPDNDYANQHAGQNAVDYANDRRRYGYGYGYNRASFSNAQQQADYNNDGFVSAAESQQFHRQKNVEDRAVYSESVKRRNVTNTARDARDGLGAVKDIQRIFKSF